MTKLAALIGLKDEVDLIGPCIRQLKALGADVIVVFDDRSTDGSREIVEAMAAEDPRIRLAGMEIDLTREGPVFGPIFDEFDPDWLLATDADEIWISRNGGIKDCPLLAEHDLITVPRYNVPLTHDVADAADRLQRVEMSDLPLIVEREVLRRDTLDTDPSKRWVMHAIGPKVLCRGSTFKGFGLGGHQMSDKDKSLRKATADDLLIAHVPFSTYERFERKVQNIRRVFELGDDKFAGSAAWHWRRWLQLFDEGKLAAEFEAQRMDAAEIGQHRKAGVLRTAAELFAGSAR